MYVYYINILFIFKNVHTFNNKNVVRSIFGNNVLNIFKRGNNVSIFLFYKRYKLIYIAPFSKFNNAPLIKAF